ncbi:TetR/AcrR family transcriptional regulator [Actinoalloteichus hymeniacidonis]|uniref:Transcriptional regulator, TetR family n=1 Tax=Actinoalloteichus hymeniacidonis TaxID=340345 RepID=A0AAC9MZ59_9PSEU|nr:TetR/AcrR family transcriptional regulator [Actinoalloteichus hymeniacidonis]AOS64020.1 transcriptional regulator, TetR family [Actinoalloteichus hymeniacidonis]MBB5907918.1 AcrR family transcriptional regulator [Actinoalloteichus hymeniacidonis]
MDPRVARTRASLQKALLDLARERPLDDVTVGDIASRAGVNRSSFYQHYVDKETLLAEALEDALHDVSTQLPEAPALTGTLSMPIELITYLDHIAANAAVYRRVLGEHGSTLIAARLRQRVETIVRETVGAAGSAARTDLPVDVVAAGIAGSALGVITAWIARDPLPLPSVAADWLWRVLLGIGAWRQPEDDEESGQPG